MISVRCGVDIMSFRLGIAMGSGKWMKGGGWGLISEVDVGQPLAQEADQSACSRMAVPAG